MFTRSLVYNMKIKADSGNKLNIPDIFAFCYVSSML